MEKLRLPIEISGCDVDLKTTRFGKKNEHNFDEDNITFEFFDGYAIASVRYFAIIRGKAKQESVEVSVGGIFDAEDFEINMADYLEKYFEKEISRYIVENIKLTDGK